MASRISPEVDTPRIALASLQAANEMLHGVDVRGSAAAAQVSCAASQLVIAELLELLLTEVRELRTALSSRRVGL